MCSNKRVCEIMNLNAINLNGRISKINFLGETEKQNQDVTRPQEKVGGFGPSIGALTTSQLAPLCSLPISLGLIFPAMQKQGNIPEADIKVLKDATTEVIKKSGLDTKGVKIEWLKPFDTTQSKMEILKADIMNPIAAVKNGRNAFFVMKDGILPGEGLNIVQKNTILMPENKITYAAFHELGHAMNANLSKWGRALQKMRPFAMAIPSFIAMYGAISRKSKPDTEGKLTKKQKVNNAIRNNAGKLAFVATIPMLIEEALATKKGLKFAKEILSPDLYKKVAKGNRVAYLSYVTASIFAGLSAWVAVKVKDNMIAKKEQKREELYKTAIAS